MGIGSKIKDAKRIFSQDGSFEAVNSRISNLETHEYKITYYEVVSGTSGTLTVPSQGTINADEFGLSGNAILSKIDVNGKPTFESPVTSGGSPVTASLNVLTGAWVASAAYTDANVALIYSIKINALYYDNLVYSNIIETVKVTADVGTTTLQSVTDAGNTTTNAIETAGITTDYVQLDTTATTTGAVGKLTWNDVDGTANLGLKGGNVTLQIGQEFLARVVNKTATNISLLESNYQAVRITGAIGQRPKVDLALADNDLNSATTLGLVTETIANNAEGFITTSGQVKEINTTGSLQGETWVDGDTLYLSGTVAGRITNIKPIAPIHTVIIGFVEYAHAIHGKIFVKVNNGYELEELHNVSAIAPNNNEVLTYETSSTLWKPKTVVSALGYTPYNATNPSGFITSSALTPYLTTASAALTYFPIPTGTTSQYLRGDGTLATFPTIPTVTPSALTKTDDTNVTLTLGGSPSTALLAATSITVGWTGTLADSRIASAATWNAKQDALSGTGFVKSTAGVISYDTSTYLTTADAASTYYPLTNPAGYITASSLTGYVPYTGATANVDLGIYELSTPKLNGSKMNLVGTDNALDGIFLSNSTFVNVPNLGISSNKVSLTARGFSLSNDSAVLTGSYITSFGMGLAVNRSGGLVSLKNLTGYSLLVEAGNVGILTANPQTALQVAGNITTTWADSNFGTWFANGSDYRLGFNTIISQRQTNIHAYSVDTGGYITFSTGTNTTPFVNARINPKQTSGSLSNFIFTKPDNTGQTASTSIAGFNYNGGTRQWLTGNIGTQNENVWGATTYSFVGASTITNAYGNVFNAPIASTNCTITNNFAARFNGNVEINGSITNSGGLPSIGSAATPYGTFFITNVRGGTNLTLGSGFSTSGDRGLTMFASTRNVTIQNGGTFVDNGYRLDVQGTTRITGDTTIGSTGQLIEIKQTANAPTYTQTGATSSVFRLNAGTRSLLFETYGTDQNYFTSYGANFRIRTGDALPIQFYTNNTGRLTIPATGGLQFSESNNLIFGTTTGTKFGETNAQKLAFWNATPIVQPANTTSLNGVLENTGLMASGSTISTINKPLVVGANTTPRTGVATDGVTSVLGDLKTWAANYHSGEVLYNEVSGEALNFGQLCYRDATGKWQRATGSSSTIASYNMLGICLQTVAGIDTAISILTRGYVESTYLSAGAVGNPLFMDATTAGSITNTAPSTAGNVVRVIGNVFWSSALQTNSKWIVYFNPDNTWIEL